MAFQPFQGAYLSHEPKHWKTVAHSFCGKDGSSPKGSMRTKVRKPPTSETVHATQRSDKLKWLATLKEPAGQTYLNTISLFEENYLQLCKKLAVVVEPPVPQKLR